MITSTPYVPYYQPCPAQGPYNPNRCAAPPAMIAPPVAMAVGYNQRHATDMQARPPWEVGRPTTGAMSPYWDRFLKWGIGAFCVVMLYQYLSKDGRRRTLNPWMLAGVPALVGYLAADFGKGT